MNHLTAYPDTAPPWLPCDQLDEVRETHARAIADLTLLGIYPVTERITSAYRAMRAECDRVHADRREYLRATRLDILLGVTA